MGTSSLCVNGTSVILTSTNTGFPISSDVVSFTGASTGASASGSSSSIAKRGASFDQVSTLLPVAVACAALAFVVI